MKNMDTIGNKYKIGDILGSGGYGTLFRARNIRTNEEVAVKVEPINNNTKLLKNETKIYQYLNSFCQKGIPKVLWYGSDKDNYYMVMELLGYSLKEVNYSTIQLIGIQIINRKYPTSIVIFNPSPADFDKNEFSRGVITDKQLIENVYPLARDQRYQDFLFSLRAKREILVDPDTALNQYIIK